MANPKTRSVRDIEDELNVNLSSFRGLPDTIARMQVFIEFGGSPLEMLTLAAKFNEQTDSVKRLWSELIDVRYPGARDPGEFIK